MSGVRPTRPALVVAVHGTRSAAGQAVAHGLVDAVGRRLPGTEVRVGWADLLSPTLTETLAGLDEAVVVPCFLTAGYHVTSDLPAAVDASGGRARLAGMIGPGLLAAVADRLREAGEPADAVVLAAAGSRRRRSVAEVATAARQLSELIGRVVVPAYLTAAEPGVGEAVAALRAAGHARVAIASYLLAPGVFADRLREAGADVVSAPIGVHPLVVEAVLSAYASLGSTELDLPDALSTAPGVERIA
ncbi:sirohydrochlorin chelatase [Propionicimonas sp.]|uniref:sirohydrochlorin chelatase n=1 Tax=Propionicimonas sp. TaxID=1955623 RepID=UPI0039E6EAE4